MAATSPSGSTAPTYAGAIVPVGDARYARGIGAPAIDQVIAQGLAHCDDTVRAADQRAADALEDGVHPAAAETFDQLRPLREDVLGEEDEARAGPSRRV